MGLAFGTGMSCGRCFENECDCPPYTEAEIREIRAQRAAWQEERRGRPACESSIDNVAYIVAKLYGAE